MPVPGKPLEQPVVVTPETVKEFSAVVNQEKTVEKTLVVRNSESKPLDLIVAVEGNARELVTFHTTTFRVEPGQEAKVDLRLYARPGTPPGEYTAFFVVRTMSGEVVQRVPVKITVLVKGERLMDTAISKYPRAAMPGEEILVGLNLVNVGDNSKFDATLTYALESPGGKATRIYSETVSLSDRLYYERKITLPEGLAPGEYRLQVSAEYFDESTNQWRKAPSSALLEILPPKEVAVPNNAWQGVALLAAMALFIVAYEYYRFRKGGRGGLKEFASQAYQSIWRSKPKKAEKL